MFKRFIKRKQSLANGSVSDQELSTMKNFLQMIEKTEDRELSCDEVFDLIDIYVDLEIQGEDVSAILPMVKKHLESCPDCREEYEALLRVVEASQRQEI
jgi:hypothetical protein